MTITKALILISAIGLISSACLAGQAEGFPGKNPPLSGVQKSVKANEMRGKVEKVILADLATETRPKITIIAQDGQRHTFVIRSTTTIYDPQWKPITLDKIIIGQFVRIKYKINKEGFEVALSIKPSRVGQSEQKTTKK